MEKESNIYYHKYLKYKNKYLQAKNFLGGAEKTPGLSYRPPVGVTGEKTVYDNFYKSFTPKVLECIRVNAPLSPNELGTGGCGYEIEIDTSSPSGIYFKFKWNDKNKISVHIDKDVPNKIHICQANLGIYGNLMETINFSLAIEYDKGNLRLIRRGNLRNLRNKNGQSWLSIRQEFTDLLTLIERCINDANTSKMDGTKLNFEGEEGTGVACENPKAAGAGPWSRA